MLDGPAIRAVEPTEETILVAAVRPEERPRLLLDGVLDVPASVLGLLRAVVVPAYLEAAHGDRSLL